ncbi:hypothetical protein MKEN_00946700 [Mycena kentingensis (nom. inval.)]|nr:hypothetical protein MKEN_00946700 [Mycena kentingensis (nom. inval.)]
MHLASTDAYSTILLALISLIPNHVVRIMALCLIAVLFSLRYFYLQCPRLQLEKLAELIDETEGVLSGAKAACAGRSFCALRAVEVQLFEIKCSQSRLQCLLFSGPQHGIYSRWRYLKAWNFWGRVSELIKDTKGLRNSVRSIVEADRQCRLTNKIERWKSCSGAAGCGAV